MVDHPHENHFPLWILKPYNSFALSLIEDLIQIFILIFKVDIMKTAILSPKISSRSAHSFSHRHEEKMISLRKSGVIHFNMTNYEPSWRNAKLKVSACSKFDNDAAVPSVNGKIVSKSGSTATTQKSDMLSKDVPGDMLFTFPKGESRSQIETSKGLGIVDFLKDKNFLITGATGFLAKVLIEKILRMQPEVGKLFVLIKAKDYESALQRLKNEVICSDLFKCIQETQGSAYEQFMLKKLVPVVGDITAHKLGIQVGMAEELSEEVDIVFNCAANTTFDERYDVALEINTKGAGRMLEFAKCCKRLQLFLQMSTAYVNGKRQGRVLEKPLHMGETTARENAQLEPIHSSLSLDIQAEFELSNKTQEANSILLNSDSHNALDVKKQLVQAKKDLGMERAQTYGWQDTYVFTKAMGEMLIDNGREDFPVVIVRPSVIESTYHDPFPGWIEGNRMMDPIILYYGKGQLGGFLADPDGVLDVVPADMVVNATLAAMAKHSGKSGLDIYHVGTSVANPLMFGELAGLVTQHFKSNPYVDSKGNPVTVKKVQFFGDVEEFSTHMWSHLSNVLPNKGSNGSSCSKMMLEKSKKIFAKSIEQARYLANIYKPYTFYEGRFDISNTEGLFEELSEEEKQNFGFDVRSINWIDYISKIHIAGLRQHVMKGRGTKLE